MRQIVESIFKSIIDGRSRISLLAGMILLFFSTPLLFSKPEIYKLQPASFSLGEPFILTVQGKDLVDAKLFLNSKAKVKVLDNSQSKKATYQIELPKTLGVGIAPLFVLNSKGLSDPILVAIDDLPIRQEREKPSRIPLSLFGEIDREEGTQVHFQIEKPQSLTFEVISRRLGELLDPHVSIYGPQGQLLKAIDDSAGLGGDSRFKVYFDRKGQYSAVIRDSAFSVPKKNRFHFRIGQFPDQGTSRPLSTHGNFFGVGNYRWGSERYQYLQEPGALGSAFHATLKAQGMVVFEGCFERAGQVFEFPIPFKGLSQGERLQAFGFSRSLGSSAELLFELLDGNKKVIDRSDPKGGDEGELTYTSKGEKSFILRVTELTGRASSNHRFLIWAQRGVEDFELSFKERTISGKAGEWVEVEIECNRNKYKGAIDLSALIGVRKLEVKDHIIPKNKKNVRLKINIDPSMQQNQVYQISIHGRATSGVNTRGYKIAQTNRIYGDLLKLLPALPLELRDGIYLGIR